MSVESAEIKGRNGRLPDFISGCRVNEFGELSLECGGPVGVHGSPGLEIIEEFVTALHRNQGNERPGVRRRSGWSGSIENAREAA
jgi:hypothetical protein